MSNCTRNDCSAYVLSCRTLCSAEKLPDSCCNPLRLISSPALAFCICVGCLLHLDSRLVVTQRCLKGMHSILWEVGHAALTEKPVCPWVQAWILPSCNKFLIRCLTIEWVCFLKRLGTIRQMNQSSCSTCGESLSAFAEGSPRSTSEPERALRTGRSDHR